jgi:hypothetical protein
VTAFCALAIALALQRPPQLMAAGQGTFTLSGRITTDYGCALSEVTVVVSLEAAGSEVLGKAITDLDGRYAFDRLPEPKGPIKIVAEARGFARATHTMSLARDYPNLWDAGLKLGRLADTDHRLVGIVVDARKRPVSDATVSVLRPHIDGELDQVRTDAAGRFLFDNIDPGAYVVIVTRPAYEPASRLVEATPSTSKAGPENFTLASCKRCPQGRLP